LLAVDDFEQWRPLWLAYLDFYRTEVTDETTTGTFGRLTSHTGGLVGLVAEEGGHLVGIAHLVFHPSTWTLGDYCYLEDLFVAPSARGTGAARRLLDAAFEEADRRGARRTYWETQEFNSQARSLYDQVAHRTSFIVYER
jgi:GNAT superfamily N-acetyltransferase